MRLGFLFLLLLPLGAHAFVTWRVWQLLPLPVWAKALVSLLMAACFCLAFVALSRHLDTMPMPVATLVYEVGLSWLIAMLYLMVFFLLSSLLSGMHLFPREMMRNSMEGSVLMIVAVTATLVYGYHHYNNKVRQSMTLMTEKALKKDGLRLVMVSDLHLGYHNDRHELARWIDLINDEHPDVVLIAGDIIDRSMRPLEETGMAEEFHRLTAPVVACLGNHEYYAGQPSSIHFYEEAGICLLKDSVCTIGDLCIVGRDDGSNRGRAPLAELMNQADKRKYVIVLDHQPHHLEEAEQANVDLQLSGHTHQGQVWPLSWVTNAMYECAHGLHQRKETQYYVSSGLGIWGGKFRIGTQSEYAVIELRHRQMRH